jgi:serine/threonine protein kinase
MKQGDIIGGYRIVSEPTNNGGGRCVWAFAEKDGKEYFIKRFLEPKRPGADSTASEASKKLRLDECKEFEDRHREIMDRLKPDASGAGNIVLAVAFFHKGSTYYKLTERIDTSTLEAPQALASRQKVVLLKTLGLSLRLLHDIDVVHGDLKPANVLIQRKAAVKAFYTAKLIDFDDSYISGRPPERDIIVGDSLYGAPEWRRYLQGDDAIQPEYLTVKTDIFALGLMTHYYLTGTIPGYGTSFGSPADAVNAGAALRFDNRLTSAMQDLIRAMTSRAPGARPQITMFLTALQEPDICELSRKRRSDNRSAKRNAERPPDAAGGTARTSRLRTNLGTGPSASPRTVTPPRWTDVDDGVAAPAPGPAADDKDTTDLAAGPAERRTSRVRINLGNCPR